VFATYVEFKRLYPDEFKFASKSELAEKQNFPSELPDGYLTRTETSENQTKYFLDCFEDTTEYRRLVHKIRQHIGYAEGDSWKSVFPILPTMLMVCESTKLQRRMTRIAQRELQSSIASLQFLVITFDKLSGSKSNEKATWSNVEDPEELVTL
jgi:hypothetical protein